MAGMVWWMAGRRADERGRVCAMPARAGLMVASLKNGAGSVNAVAGAGEGALGWDAGVNPYCRGRWE